MGSIFFYIFHFFIYKIKMSDNSTKEIEGDKREKKNNEKNNSISNNNNNNTNNSSNNHRNNGNNEPVEKVELPQFQLALIFLFLMNYLTNQVFKPVGFQNTVDVQTGKKITPIHTLYSIQNWSRK